MFRPITRFGLLAAAAVGMMWISGGQSNRPLRAQPPVPAERDDAAPAASGAKVEATRAENQAGELRRRLAMPMTVEFEPNTPLKEALKWVSDKAGVTILVDTEAFKTDLNVTEIENQPVTLAKMNLRLGTVLEKLAAQVQGSFLVRPDHIAITTMDRARVAVWGTLEADENVSGRPRPLLPLVHVALGKRPLDAALQTLADATGFSVILDRRRAGDQARAVVSATLNNVPLDTAVRLLANQAGLQAVLLENALYVTT